MTELTIQQACKNLHWHDSWSEYMKYDETKQELIIEILLCEWINDEDFLFNGQEGTLIFYGVSDYSMDTNITSENTGIEFSGGECLSSEAKMGLQLVGYAYKDVKGRSYDWFTLRFFADSATWHPKTNNESPITKNQ